ncbi:Unknown protein [Striga hermonthica]|uniref:SCP domain-containing protein n=1 Tax=Striga hermonthica TaxID=68872 RepID=A0A9N7NGQ1_STRHE|nr:Unknown protein [Striga hermonthica]
MPSPRIWGFLLLASVLASATSATVHHDTPREKLKRRGASGAAAHPPAPFVPSYNLEQQEYLTAHNDFRLRAGVPPLSWDPGVYVVCNYDPAGLIPGVNPFTGSKNHSAQ